MNTNELDAVKSVARRRWTLEEEDVLRRYYPLPRALPVGKLAAFFGRSETSVIRKVSQMRLHRNGE
jgi:hypothetical protein